MSSKSRKQLPGSENVPDGKAFTMVPSDFFHSTRVTFVQSVVSLFPLFLFSSE